MNTIDALRVQIEALRREFPDVFEDEDMAADVLEGETDLFSVINRLSEQIGDAEMDVYAISERVLELNARKERRKRAAESGRVAIQRLMEAAGQTKITLPTATLSLRPLPPKVVIIDEAELPEDVWRVVREVDKQALRARLKDGEDVPGAAMSNGGVGLTIRRT